MNIIEKLASLAFIIVTMIIIPKFLLLSLQANFPFILRFFRSFLRGPFFPVTHPPNPRFIEQHAVPGVHCCTSCTAADTAYYYCDNRNNARTSKELKGICIGISPGIIYPISSALLGNCMVLSPPKDSPRFREKRSFWNGIGIDILGGYFGPVETKFFLLEILNEFEVHSVCT